MTARSGRNRPRNCHQPIYGFGQRKRRWSCGPPSHFLRDRILTHGTDGAKARFEPSTPTRCIRACGQMAGNAAISSHVSAATRRRIIWLKRAPSRSTPPFGSIGQARTGAAPTRNGSARSEAPRSTIDTNTSTSCGAIVLSGTAPARSVTAAAAIKPRSMASRRETSSSVANSCGRRHQTLPCEANDISTAVRVSACPVITVIENAACSAARLGGPASDRQGLGDSLPWPAVVSPTGIGVTSRAGASLHGAPVLGLGERVASHQAKVLARPTTFSAVNLTHSATCLLTLL
jgi:hypothetical protein